MRFAKETLDWEVRGVGNLRFALVNLDKRTESSWGLGDRESILPCMPNLACVNGICSQTSTVCFTWIEMLYIRIIYGAS